MEFLKPKTSCKTSCFFLNDAMFWRCFWKNINVDVFDDVLQNTKYRAYDASNDVNRPPLHATYISLRHLKIVNFVTCITWYWWTHSFDGVFSVISSLKVKHLFIALKRSFLIHIRQYCCLSIHDGGKVQTPNDTTHDTETRSLVHLIFLAKVQAYDKRTVKSG